MKYSTLRDPIILPPHLSATLLNQPKSDTGDQHIELKTRHGDTFSCIVVQSQLITGVGETYKTATGVEAHRESYTMFRTDQIRSVKIVPQPK